MDEQPYRCGFFSKTPAAQTRASRNTSAVFVTAGALLAVGGPSVACGTPTALTAPQNDAHIVQPRAEVEHPAVDIFALKASANFFLDANKARAERCESHNAAAQFGHSAAVRPWLEVLTALGATGAMRQSFDNCGRTLELRCGMGLTCTDGVDLSPTCHGHQLASENKACDPARRWKFRRVDLPRNSWVRAKIAIEGASATQI